VTEIQGSPRPRPYPVRVDAELEPRLSRWLWLVKWLLLIPHYVALAFLWIAFVALTVVAFFAILVTGRYPRAIFEFNLGVLRWTWRVHYYGYLALGTDRYPPFTLADVPDYPAHLDVPYPQRLSRGLVLVKWWLLALPHYLVLAVFVGGGIWLGTRGGSDGANGPWDDGWAFGGLVALLVLVAGVVLLFTGRYPAPVYDFVLGMDRWAYRVGAYAALMTDAYPPFRLDLGGSDPGSVPRGPAPVPPVGGAVVVRAPQQPHGSWSAGRVLTVVLGAVLLLVSTGFLLGGGTLLWADQTQRADGFVWSGTTQVDTDRYAIASDAIVLEGAGADWALDRFLGTARIEARASDGATPVFVGVATSRDAAAYLHGVGHRRLDGIGPMWDNSPMGPGVMQDFRGGRPATPPADADFWVAQSTGSGTQVVDWRPENGNWTVVVMRADGRAGVDVEARVGVSAPQLGLLAGGLLVGGAVLLAAGASLVAVAVHRAQRGTGELPPPAPAPVDGGPRGRPEVPLPRTVRAGDPTPRT
jgi:hypothetical protein